ncbi:MAG: MerR family DNA-binding transcriptional regulator [Thermomicrobiales bacterium]
MERLTIGEVARRSGISIRMLRHYDEIGLVRPGVRRTTGIATSGSTTSCAFRRSSRCASSGSA